IDSMPPPTPTCTSPARIAWSRITVARRPEAQTLLIVSEETSLGMPALIRAWREGICPWPACSTWPTTTCSTCSGSTPARSRAALIANPPSSVASSEDRPPPILPMGVRAAPRITVLGMWSALSCRSCKVTGRGRMVVDGHAQRVQRRAGRRCTILDMVARMQISAIAQPARDSDADTIAVGIFEGEGAPPQAPAELGGLITSGEARRSFKSLALTHAGGKRWLTVGLGARKDFTPERARVAASVVAGRARELSTRTLCGEVPADGDEAIAGALVEGTLLSDYRFDLHKSDPEDREHDAPPKHLEALLIAGGDGLGDVVAEAALVGEAVNRARDLQNRPGNDL